MKVLIIGLLSILSFSAFSQTSFESFRADFAKAKVLKKPEKILSKNAYDCVAYSSWNANAGLSKAKFEILNKTSFSVQTTEANGTTNNFHMFEIKEGYMSFNSGVTILARTNSEKLILLEISMNKDYAEKQGAMAIYNASPVDVLKTGRVISHIACVTE